jgi:hypothetical protein
MGSFCHASEKSIPAEGGDHSSHSRVRALLDIGALDTQIQRRIAQHGSVKDFSVVLWRDEPDATGCNWNARIERVEGSRSDDSSWWGLVPQMRARFNLI